MAFLKACRAMTTDDLLSPLMEVADADERVSQHLWVLVFPIVWASLAKSVQVALAKPIISLISKFSEEVAQVAYQPVERREGKQTSHQRVRPPSVPSPLPH